MIHAARLVLWKRLAALFMVIVLAVALFGVNGAQPAQAATITVTNLGDFQGAVCPDAANCTLRQALAVAQDGDTITFSVSGTIMLNSKLPAVNGTLTIDGTGRNVSIGNSNGEVTQVNTGGSLSLKTLTFGNGNNDLGGGMIVNEGGTVSIINSIFSNNSTISGGGAISNIDGGTLNIVNSTFSANSDDITCGYGGAIYNESTLNVANSTFNSNSGCGGGAIYNHGGMLDINNSVFSGNSDFSPNVGGGAIYSDNGTLSVTNSTFFDNSGGYGGAILTYGTLNVVNSTFSENSAVFSGGAIVNNGTLNIANSAFFNNSMSNLYFGGSAVGNYGTLNITNSTFSANSAPGGGGAIVNNYGGTSRLNNSILTNDTGGDCANGTSGGGGASTGIYNLSDGSCSGTLSVATGVSTTLANNSGLTQTFALSSSSNAIDAVPDSACVYVSSGKNPLFTDGATITTDQRGVSRPVGGCDIGSYEYWPPTPNIDSVGIFRTSTFYLRLHNSTGVADTTPAFNPASKPYPLVGDWIGQGFDTIGIFDQSTGQFSLRNSNTTGSPDEQFTLGNPNDIPLSGKWTSGFTHFGAGVFRPSNGLIYLKNNLTTGFADFTMVMGIPGDTGLAGDWNGDGLDSPGVYRPSNQHFYLTDQACNCSVTGSYQLQYGVSGDVPIIGDWIGQGHDGVGLFRQSNGFTYLRTSLTTGYADITFTYGLSGDIPIAGHWQLIYPPAAPPSVFVPNGTPPTPGIHDGLGD